MKICHPQTKIGVARFFSTVCVAYATLTWHMPLIILNHLRGCGICHTCKRALRPMFGSVWHMPHSRPKLPTNAPSVMYAFHIVWHMPHISPKTSQQGPRSCVCIPHVWHMPHIPTPPIVTGSGAPMKCGICDSYRSAVLVERGICHQFVDVRVILW